MLGGEIIVTSNDNENRICNFGKQKNVEPFNSEIGIIYSKLDFEELSMFTEAQLPAALWDTPRMC